MVCRHECLDGIINQSICISTDQSEGKVWNAFCIRIFSKAESCWCRAKSFVSPVAVSFLFLRTWYKLWVVGVRMGPQKTAWRFDILITFLRADKVWKPLPGNSSSDSPLVALPTEAANLRHIHLLARPPNLVGRIGSWHPFGFWVIFGSLLFLVSRWYWGFDDTRRFWELKFSRRRGLWISRRVKRIIQNLKEVDSSGRPGSCSVLLYSFTKMCIYCICRRYACTFSFVSKRLPTDFIEASMCRTQLV